ncbi:MAG: hypothetical protein Q9M97_09185 [Candidatus Gracilibacteria bacterium]|nr:hypothetical protein [Candidatus Gracilibacteria bacterium]
MPFNRKKWLSSNRFYRFKLPQFSVPYLDAIKVTTFVNLEQDTTFLVDTLKNIIEPLNSSTNNWANKFSNAGMDSLDFSSKSINIYKKIDLNKKDDKTSFDKNISKKIINLYSYIGK